MSNRPLFVFRALTALLVVLATAGASVAVADTAPPSGTPTTTSSDALPTAQINGVVWTQLVVGDTVFAGGSFSTARPAGAAAGSGTVARSNLLAYRLSTGALLSSFAPKVNGTVRALAASSDGTKLYVGGDFTAIGSTPVQRLASLSASTGAVDSGFAPQPNGSVYALARSGSTVFAGGAFTRIGSADRTRAAAVSTSGALLAWAPVVPDGRVNAIVVNSAVGRVALAGSFSGLDGRTAPYRGSGLVDSSTGKTPLPWSVGDRVKDYGNDAAITSLASDGTNIYGTGYDYGAGSQGDLEGTFSAPWSTGALRWIEDCHGDSYSSTVLGSAVYIAGHPHDCQRIGGFPETNPRSHHRALAFTTAVTGVVAHNTVSGYDDWGGAPAPSLLTWFPDFNTGTYTGQGQGPWSVASNGSYVVYGGEFTTVNGKGQQGLVRFAVPAIAPNKDGPRIMSGDLAVTVSGTGTSRTVSWKTVSDRDNSSLTYSLKRNGTTIATRTASSTFWKRPTITVVDSAAGTAPRYQVTVADPYGNSAAGPASAASATAGPAQDAVGSGPTPEGRSDEDALEGR